eukprot:jgi/Hompol1/1077/HPOL_001373-RA
MSQQLEIEEKTQTIQQLKKEQARIRELIKEQNQQSQKALKSQLGLQRKEYETIVKRHLTFIDKLIGEKEELSRNCEELSLQVKQLEKQFVEK